MKKMIGTYEVIELAGEGAFGKVYKVKNDTDSEIRAIKEISKKKITPDLMENLLREVQICYKLDHENIAKCYSTLESTKHYYIIFEYCGGGDLEKFLKKTKKPDIKVALRIMRQMREMFKYLQTQNILHRDIKPENILLTDGEEINVKLSDFGCSKDDVMGVTVCGTPKYMALEVMRGDGNYDYKADLWSFGLVFWELIFGVNSFPFSHKNREELKRDIRKYSGENLRFPKFPIYPKVFYDFFKSMLDISPAMRPDAETFYNHPIFNYTGDEEEIKECLHGGSDGLKKSYTELLKFQKSRKNLDKVEEPVYGNTLAPNGGGGLADAKKAYKLKSLEVTLINSVADDLCKMLEDSWDPEFFSKFCVLIIIIIKKSSGKADTAYKTISKKANKFGVSGFEALMADEEESGKLKKEFEGIREGIKKMDDEVYAKFVKKSYSAELLENVNNIFYKKSSADKKKFVNKIWKYVCNKNDGYIVDYEKERFEKILKKIGYILKGKVAENIELFY